MARTLGTTTIQPLRRIVLRGATTAVAIDMVLFVATVVMQHFSASQFLATRRAWVSFHEPALVITTALLPGLPSALGSLPLVSIAGFMVLALVQMALMGGVLGLVYALVRRSLSAR
jgi:hypothetical protein